MSDFGNPFQVFSSMHKNPTDNKSVRAGFQNQAKKEEKEEESVLNEITQARMKIYNNTKRNSFRKLRSKADYSKDASSQSSTMSQKMEVLNQLHDKFIKKFK